jgi:hypothetical protein
MIVALVIQHAKRMRRIVICGFCGSTLFFHIISKVARFSKKKKVTENNMCFDFSTTFVYNIFHSTRKSSRFHHARLHVKYLKSCQILIKLELSRQFFEKILKYEKKWKSFRWEPSCSMWTDGQIWRCNIAFGNFANAPKNSHRK